MSEFDGNIRQVGTTLITNNQVAVGLAQGLDVVEDGAPASVAITDYGVNGVTNSPGFIGRAARGSLAAPTAVQTNDLLGSFAARGYGATSFSASSRGRTGIWAAEPWSDTTQGTYWSVQITQPTTVVTSEVMRLAALVNVTGTFGALGLNTTPATGFTVDLTQPASTSGTPTSLRLTGGAHTTLAAGVEAVDVNLNLARTVQFATGALTTQRAALVQAPTYAFVAASTITTASTVAITGAPVAGTNATITNAYALNVQAGLANFGGGYQLNTVTKTAAYAILSTDSIIFVDTMSAGFTLTLPNPAPLAGKIFKIIDSTGNLATNNLTLARFGTELIEGLAASKLLQTAWGGWTVTTDGTNWFVI